MILNGFADHDGWLYWCRHREKPTMVRRARPAELFLQNHLYSTLAESGVKNPSMEQALSVLEGEAVGVINEITGPARRGQIPVLSQEQMRLWYMFFLMQWRRTPENQLACTSDQEADRMIDEILDELRAALPHRRAEIETYATPEAKARTIRNVRVQSLLGFSANVMGVLERRGIAVLRICQPRKQFIVGSRPVVKLTTADCTDLNDPKVEMWLPVAADIAVGVGAGDGRITLVHTRDDTPVRQLNLSIAKQSSTIAAGSQRLVNSIANPR
jgi:hypothetical protein